MTPLSGAGYGYVLGPCRLDGAFCPNGPRRFPRDYFGLSEVCRESRRALFVAKYMGDGVLVYFGYPQAHEDDAERAVRAGLELIAAVGEIKSQVTLQTRIGIATGTVVVRDLIGSGAAQEQAVVGETPNLAARLQGIAEPNTVVIAESTRRLLGNLFELEDLGAKHLKGISGPMPAWSAVRLSSVESRFAAMRTVSTPLVGRDSDEVRVSSFRRCR
jgi:class 3 adenylate cyclase